jgi:hypothetical protein
LETARKRKLRRKAISWRKDAGPQLPRMSLHLVSMFIHASEEVPSAVHIQHHSAPSVVVLHSRIVVATRLDPIGLEFCPLSSPLPPFVPAHLINASVSKLLDQDICGFGNLLCGYCHRVNFDPSWMRHPLRCESLKLLDCVVGCMAQE